MVGLSLFLWEGPSPAKKQDAAPKSTISKTESNPYVARVSVPDYKNIKSALDRIAKAPGVVVVCLGDSQMYGSSTSPDKTIPAYLAAALHRRYPGRQISVFSLGLKGLNPSEAYFLMRKLAVLKVDILVYNVSRGWFSPGEKVKNPVLVWSTGGEKEAARLGIPLKPLTKEQIDASTIRQDPKAVKQRQQEEARLALNWRVKPELLPKGPKYRLGAVGLGENNLQWQLYRASISVWQQTGRPALFFLSPANWELLGLKYNIDFPAVQADQKTIKDAAQLKGIPCPDYTRLVDSKFFADEIHLQQEGHRQVAEKLAAWLTAMPAAKALLTGAPVGTAGSK